MVSPKNEKVDDATVDGKKSLRLAWRFETSHLALSLSCPLVRYFGSIVGVPLRAMAYRGHHVHPRRSTASKLVRHDLDRCGFFSPQELSEEPSRRLLVATFLDKNVNHLTVLINCAPKVLESTADLHEDLVQMPNVTDSPIAPAKPSGIFSTELATPLANGFVGHENPSLSQEIFDVAQAEREAMIEPHRVADDLRGKTVSLVADRVLGH
jgi:hypothetical protein